MAAKRNPVNINLIIEQGKREEEERRLREQNKEDKNTSEPKNNSENVIAQKNATKGNSSNIETSPSNGEDNNNTASTPSKETEQNPPEESASLDLNKKVSKLEKDLKKSLRDDIEPKLKQNNPIPQRFSQRLDSLSSALGISKYHLHSQVLDHFFLKNSKDIDFILDEYKKKLF